MKQFKQLLAFTIVLIFCLHAHAQVSISNPSSLPDASSMLDIKSTSKGILIPRMTSAERTNISLPSQGLLVFDITTNSFWFHNGSVWTQLLSGAASGWGLTGNSGTDTSLNFVGTTDSRDLKFRVGSVRSGTIGTNGNVFFGINSGGGNSTGFSNTGIGSNALITMASGNKNSAFGANSDISPGTLVNSTAIGANALVSASNSMVLGSISGVNGAAANTKVGIGTSSPLSPLEIRANSLPDNLDNAQIVLVENEDDRARMRLKSTTNFNYWELSGLTNNTSSVARLDINYNSDTLLRLRGDGNHLLHGSLVINPFNSSAVADQNAALDIQVGSKGILIPRVSIGNRPLMSNPATGLLIYQTDATPGFYYNRGTPALPSWVRIGEEDPGYNNRRTFFTFGMSNFIVPANVSRIYFEAVSAGGGRGGHYFDGGTNYRWGGGGGGGTLLQGYIEVTAGQTLSVVIGDPGTNGTDGTGSAGFGNNGGATSISIGSSVFQIPGGQSGSPGTVGASGAGGGPGGSVTYNSSICFILNSWSGTGGLSGTTTNSVTNNFSGVGGNVGRMGQFNYLFPVIHFSEPQASLSFTYVPFPFYGKGDGRGASASGGYVYLYW